MVCAAPISDIIGNKDAIGQIAKWAIELAPYTPQYERRNILNKKLIRSILDAFDLVDIPRLSFPDLGHLKREKRSTVALRPRYPSEKETMQERVVMALAGR